MSLPDYTPASVRFGSDRPTNQRGAGSLLAIGGETGAVADVIARENLKILDSFRC